MDKQLERDALLKAINDQPKNIDNLSASYVHKLVTTGRITTQEVYDSFLYKAKQAHQLTNCLTEIIKPPQARSHGPLAGVPVSLKDNFGIGGYDATMGFERRCFKPIKMDSPLVRLLKDAGAILYVKTNVPTGMMSIHSSNSVWGTTLHPTKPGFSPGGSSSGEASLIAKGGSLVGIGTDIGGSVRIPAHFCGLYSLRMSSNRFPRYPVEDTSIPGFEGIPDVSSPLSRTFSDLEFFIKGVMSMKPSTYCYQALPLPWNPIRAESVRKAGFLINDGYLDCTPPVKRAVLEAVETLRKKGVEVVEFNLPQPGHVYDEAVASLLLADGMETVAKPFKSCEIIDPVIRIVRAYSWLPRCIRRVLEWVIRYILRDKDEAEFLRMVGPFSATDYYKMVHNREKLRAEFYDAWEKADIDILVLPVFPTPALPLNHTVSDSACNYCAIFNLLDYPAGVVPITKVNPTLDSHPDEPSNSQSRSYMKLYDAELMKDLPVGVQVVGKRYCDEMVMAGMELLSHSNPH